MTYFELSKAGRTINITALIGGLLAAVFLLASIPAYLDLAASL